MAWLKVSFPAGSEVMEALVPVRLARLAASFFAERGPAEFFAEIFLVFGFVIKSSVDVARPNGASIAVEPATVNLHRAVWTASVARSLWFLRVRRRRQNS
jgi:hypothetical protein